MAEIRYECDDKGIIHGRVWDGERIIHFVLSTDALMIAKDHGLQLLDEVITAAIKDLEEHQAEPATVSPIVVQSVTMVPTPIL